MAIYQIAESQGATLEDRVKRRLVYQHADHDTGAREHVIDTGHSGCGFSQGFAGLR